MRLEDFDFALPKELIAQRPLTPRSSSRLLFLQRKTGKISHLCFSDLPGLLAPHDLLIFNDTRVIPARLEVTRSSGGRREVLVERILDSKRLLGQIRGRGKLRLGEYLILTPEISFQFTREAGELVELALQGEGDVAAVLRSHGQVPLPPYIKRTPESCDESAYQTIYACKPGAVAAPTAGLHFDRMVLNELARREVSWDFITLHVGLGTFQPVRTANVAEHSMHSEYMEIGAATCDLINRANGEGRRVVAIGTTTLRALESVSRQGKLYPYRGNTELFIYGNYSFSSCNMLLTNFHLPRSTLLMLVCSFGGYSRVMAAYREAIAQSYRFYSYGDAMLIG